MPLYIWSLVTEQVSHPLLADHDAIPSSAYQPGTDSTRYRQISADSYSLARLIRRVYNIDRVSFRLCKPFIGGGGF